MNDFTITGDYVLPSLGKVYKEEIDPHITLRSMTTAEEMRRMSNTEFPNKAMSEIIDECIVSGPKMSAYDMCMADYLYLMFKLRIVTYGSEYTISTICPYCTHQNINDIDLNDLYIQEFDSKLYDYMSFELPRTKKHITLQLQTPRMLDNIEEQVKRYKQKARKSKVDPQLLYNLMSLIDTVDGAKINPLELEDWIRSLPMMDVQTIIAYADKLNNFLGIDKKMEVTCDVCKIPHNTSFRFSGDFFRPTLDI